VTAVAAPIADSTKQYDGVFRLRKDTLCPVLYTQLLEVIESFVSRLGLPNRSSGVRNTLGAPLRSPAWPASCSKIFPARRRFHGVRLSPARVRGGSGEMRYNMI